MIQIEYTDVTGWAAAVRGMRNPKNSWLKSDSSFIGAVGSDVFLGDADRDLMQRLADSGTDHGKFLRMITVTVDINAPLYWWKEFDTYKVGTVANSCSTMHKLHVRDLTMEDFSVEHLSSDNWTVMQFVINGINAARREYMAAEGPERKKFQWWQMIQLLPSSYNQRRTVQLSYAVLRNMYHARKTHKLDEWHALCRWIESLPYSELMTGKKEEE